MLKEMADRSPMVGVQFAVSSDHLTELRTAWRRADEAGLHSIWLADHLCDLEGRPQLEVWSLLAAMAIDTSTALIGPLVCCHRFRNPSLLANIAGTVDRLSNGRLILGLGAGWFVAEFEAYGYDCGSIGERLDELERDLPTLRSKLNAATASHHVVPLLVGGNGERRTLRIAARHADMSNVRCSLSDFTRKVEVLRTWCRRFDRDYNDVKCTVLLRPNQIDEAPEYVRAGAEQVIVPCEPPYDISMAVGVLTRLT